jgi:hypothetical protein
MKIALPLFAFIFTGHQMTAQSNQQQKTVSYLIIDPGKKVAVVILSNTKVLLTIPARKIFKWIEKRQAQ